MSKIRWMYYPNDQKPNNQIIKTIEVFEKNHDLYDSDNHTLTSNEVLNVLTKDLQKIGYQVETDKKNKINIPVLYGENGKISKSFDVDGYEPNLKIVLEVEAGRAYTNYQVLKDFFEACMINDADFLIIAVRNIYLKSDDYSQVKRLFDAFYSNSRMVIPFKGLLIIGY